VEEVIRQQVKARLLSLRPMLLTEDGKSSLDLFDQFMEHHEFGLALHVVCDFVLGHKSPQVDRSTVDQIERLHTSMEINDRCVKDLRSQKLI
jgi:hypothetical protein